MNIGERCDGIGTRRTSANLHSAQLQMGIAWFSICFARSNRQMQAASSRSLEGLDWTSHRGWPSRLGPRGVRVGVECRSSFLFPHFLRKCLIIESPELVYTRWPFYPLEGRRKRREETFTCVALSSLLAFCPGVCRLLLLVGQGQQPVTSKLFAITQCTARPPSAPL